MSLEAFPGEEAAVGLLRNKIAAVRIRHWPQPKEVEKVEEVFHYCDVKALHGIVKSKRLWASDIFCLNDASEVDYARLVCCKALSDYPQLSITRDVFQNESDFMDAYRDFETHVCCFSAGPDLLSLWRAYGGQGSGFAIGFNSGLLRKEGDGPPSKFSVLPIVYSRGDQLGALHSFLQETLKMDEVLGQLESNPARVQTEIATALLIMMAPIKNPVFEDEREWRIMRVETPPSSDKVSFEPIRGAIVPHIEIQLKPEFFTRIVHGPTFQKDFGKRSLQMFLGKNGLDHVKVESSAIPLRSL